MINHRSSPFDLFLRQRDLSLSLLPKSLSNSTSPNLELTFFSNMIIFFFILFFFKGVLTSNTELVKLHHVFSMVDESRCDTNPMGVPVSIIAPNTGHYHRLCADLTSRTQYVSSVAKHGSSALQDLIFFMLLRLGSLSQGSALDSSFHVKSFKQTKSSAPASLTKVVVGAF